MNTLTARLSVIGVFLLGCLCGAALWHIVLLKLEREMVMAPDALARLVVRRLDQDLDLTDAQKERVHAAVIATRGDFMAVIQDSRPRLNAIFRRCHDDIRTSLTPKQQRRFDQIVAELRRNRPDLLINLPASP